MAFLKRLVRALPWLLISPLLVFFSALALAVSDLFSRNSTDRDADVLNATANLHARFEEFVREAPEQWMWAHRRWD